MSIWTEPKYPGDEVRSLMLHRADEISVISIRQYGESVLVGSYLIDGRPKAWAEMHEWCSSSYAADEVFDKYVAEAYAGGWQNYNTKIDPPVKAEDGGVTIDWSTGRAI